MCALCACSTSSTISPSSRSQSLSGFMTSRCGSSSCLRTDRPPVRADFAARIVPGPTGSRAAAVPHAAQRSLAHPAWQGRRLFVCLRACWFWPCARVEDGTGCNRRAETPSHGDSTLRSTELKGCGYNAYGMVPMIGNSRTPIDECTSSVWFTSDERKSGSNLRASRVLWRAHQPAHATCDPGVRARGAVAVVRDRDIDGLGRLEHKRLPGGTE